MQPTPSPLSSAPPALTDEATLAAALDCLLEHIPLDMQGDCTPETVYEILLHAASHQDSSGPRVLQCADHSLAPGP